MQQQFRARLLERIKQAGLEGVAADDERLLKEVVLFADRSDISEELTRLQSHFQQFADCLKAQEPVGRTLDFLSQEMNREINTIGSKAQDAVKWVQVDLGRSVVIDRVVLRPCYDDFNKIGAGFGFPVRFKVEAGDDAQFEKPATIIAA